MKQFFLFSFLLLIASSARSESFTCPLDPRGLEPKIRVHDFKINSDETIVICVPADMTLEGKPRDEYLTTYEAHLYRKNKWVRQVLSGSGSTPVKFQQRQGELFETMHLKVQGKLYPLYKEKILCEKSECRRAEKTCVFYQVRIPHPTSNDLKREKVIYTKGSTQSQEMSESDLALMASLALSGRKKAFDFFTELSPEPILMGITAPFYKNMRSLLKKMQQEGCLKVQ